MSDANDGERRATRRQALRAGVGVTLLGSLTGCVGGGNSEGDGESASSSDGSDGSESSGSSGGSGGTTTTTETTETTATAETTGSDTETATETSSPQGDSTGPETVTFPSGAGKDVTAERWGDGDCAAIFLHGVGYGRDDWEPQTTAVADEGHTALSLSLNHDDRASNVEATVGAIEYLQTERDVERIVLVGASAGANAVVKTDANTDIDVAGSFVLAPGRAGDLGAELSGRKLFVVGEGDSERFVQTTEQLHADASEPKELVFVESSEHAQGIFATATGERLQTVLVEFVNTVCSA